jgi:SPP1 gp7 family putative phage head morphogenesis protein
MMPDPHVVQAMRQFKAELLLREQAQMQEMARRWLQVETALEAQVTALAREFDERQRGGESVSQAALFRQGRYQSLLRQLRHETAQYGNFAQRLITRAQRAFGKLGIQHAATAIRVQYRDGIGAFFDVLPIEAIENMVGLAGDGSPLGQLLKQSWPDAAEGLTNALIRNTALGRNPRETAREMRRGVAQGLNRALTVARSEQLRVYREATRQQYQASGVVSGYRRLAARDDRVCPACLAADGEEYELDEVLREHANGRCGLVPNVIGLPKVQWEPGLDWFVNADAATQRGILGKGRYEAWRKGHFDLEQLVTVRRDSAWGDSVQPTPLRDLVG